MTQSLVVGLWLILAAVAANLPWLTGRWLLVIACPDDRRAKPFWLRLVEWSLLYSLIIGIGLGLEYKATGAMHGQGWEFYTVTLCLFAVSALPGFIYRYQLRWLLAQAGRAHTHRTE